MSQNYMEYWRNWLQKDEEINVTKDGYIIKYFLANKCSNEGVSNWVCCTSRERLFALIKYVILPSAQISRVIGGDEGKLYFDVIGYDDTIDILINYESKKYSDAVETYERWFRKIEELEKNKDSYEELEKYMYELSNEVSYKEYFHLDLELFRNASQIGRKLIATYEEQEMLDYLEDMVDLKKDQIIDLFENIDNNPFMLKKINTLLNENFQEV